MEYHHENAMGLVLRLAEIPLMSDDGENIRNRLRHEVVAYLNILGQFFYFSKSDFVSKRVRDFEPIIPTITKFVRFRMKHSAHRSLDWPRKTTLSI